MLSRRTEWILWAIAMVIFLVLTLSGHTMVLGLSIAVVAVIWYTVVPGAQSRRQ